jgi:hypothetical protein
VPHAQAKHEALPDLHGVAIGGADARFVVDAHRITTLCTTVVSIVTNACNLMPLCAA